jgi:hypothetical protein
MQHFVLWPMLVILGGAAATIPVVQNSTTRNILYLFVMSPIAFGLVSAIWLTGLR